MLTAKCHLIVKELIKAGLLDEDKEQEAFDIAHEQMYWGNGVHPIEHGDYCVEVEYYKTTKDGELARDQQNMLMETDARWRERRNQKRKKKYKGGVLKKALTGGR